MANRRDPAQRLQATRKQRERGCSIYIAAEDLQAAGYDPAGPPPFYRTFPGPRGSVIVNLYRTR